MNSASQTERTLQSCLEACNRCHQICLQTALSHDRRSEGTPFAAGHFRLLINCSEICQISANFQIGRSHFQDRICDICAEICEVCAEQCRKIGGMDDCVLACNDCASSCRQMVSVSH